MCTQGTKTFYALVVSPVVKTSRCQGNTRYNKKQRKTHTLCTTGTAACLFPFSFHKQARKKQQNRAGRKWFSERQLWPRALNVLKSWIRENIATLQTHLAVGRYCSYYRSHTHPFFLFRWQGQSKRWPKAISLIHLEVGSLCLAVGADGRLI